MSNQSQHRNRRGETTIVRVTEAAVRRLAAEQDAPPQWTCPHCGQLEFCGVVAVGSHMTTVCRRSHCKATIRFEVVADPAAPDRAEPIVYLPWSVPPSLRENVA